MSPPRHQPVSPISSIRVMTDYGTRRGSRMTIYNPRMEWSNQILGPANEANCLLSSASIKTSLTPLSVSGCRRYTTKRCKSGKRISTCAVACEERSQSLGGQQHHRAKIEFRRLCPRSEDARMSEVRRRSKVSRREGGRNDRAGDLSAVSELVLRCE
jgi:hypothetical protein